MSDVDAIDASERDLLALASVLDAPVPDTEYQRALLSLGQRARTMLQASRVLHENNLPSAARVLLRPMVEINLVVRFLRKAPVLHTELWHAEGARGALAIVDEHHRSSELTGRWGRIPLSDDEVAALRKEVATARAHALEAGVTGVGEKGSVLPSVVQQLATVDEPAANEAYTTAYRLQGWDVHSGPRAVQAGTWELDEHGGISYRDERGDQLGVRVIAVTTLASTLELVAAELRLAAEVGAREIRQRFVPEHLAPDQRLDALRDDEGEADATSP